jgi:hypothetical protein
MAAHMAALEPVLSDAAGLPAAARPAEDAVEQPA